MKTKIKIVLAGLAAVLFVMPMVVSAQLDCYATGADGSIYRYMCPTDGSGDNIFGLPQSAVGGQDGIIARFLLWILAIFATLALIAFAISGVMYLTSAGSETQIDRAKRVMVWAIVGIVTALSGLIILTAITNLLKGSGEI